MKLKTYITFLLVILAQLTKANTDKYRLIIRSNPATSITIAWNQISGNNAVVYYGKEDNGTNAYNYPNKKGIDRSTYFRGMDNKFSRITGLQPNTIYYFVIKDSNSVSKRFWFKTAPNDLSRLSFVSGGDSRNNREPRRNANRLVAKLKPNAVLFGGDMTSSDNSRQWQNWFDDWQLTIAPDGRMFPIVPTRGNHERGGTIYKLFDVPNADEYYAITFGNNLIRTYTLNTEISTYGDQKDWLKKDLKTNQNAIWKTVQYHKPMRPHTKHKSEGNRVYNAWAKIFYKNDVKLVVECDSHTSKTTWPIIPSNDWGSDEGFIREDEKGTIYTGEGSWGAPLRSNNDDKSWTRGSATINQFKWIFVDANKIELRTIQVDNARQVAELSNDTPFTMPRNIAIQPLYDGAKVVTIGLKNKAEKPVISFASSMSKIFKDRYNIQISVRHKNKETRIKEMILYINGKQKQTLVSAPYNFDTNVPKNGVHAIEVKAISSKGAESTIETTIYVGNFTEELTRKIQTDRDDVEEAQDGRMYFDSSDLEFGYDRYNKQGYQKVGLRFKNIEIPKGATITAAYIQFSSDEINYQKASCKIQIENVANSAPFKDIDNNLSERRMYKKEVGWNPAPWRFIHERKEAERTPSLRNQLQYIVNRKDWKIGNAITFKIIPQGVSKSRKNNKRVAQSAKSSNPPVLVYEYEFNTSFNNLSTGLQGIKNTSLRVYPNPFKSYIKIEAPYLAGKSVHVVIYNLNNEKVLDKGIHFNNTVALLDTQQLEKGLYVMHFFTKKGEPIKTVKLMK